MDLSAGFVATVELTITRDGLDIAHDADSTPNVKEETL